MLKLIKQELHDKNLNVYLKVIFIIGVFLFVFIYFVAFVAMMEKEVIFLNYRNIFQITCAISLLLFSGLSANMSYRLIIKGDVYKKQLMIRMFVIFSMIWIVMMGWTGTSIGIFLMTESIVPMIPDLITSHLVIESLKTVIISGLTVYMIGIFAMGVAVFIKSLIVIYIITFILCAIYGNAMIMNQYPLPINFTVSFIMTIIVMMIIVKKINQMEEK